MNIRIFLIALGLSLPAMLPACAPSQAPLQTIGEHPETLVIDGASWTKQPWSDKLDRKLQQYFQRNPQFADHPGFGVDPICYTLGTTERIYWVSQIGETRQWLQLEIKGTRFGEILEGEGAPF